MCSLTINFCATSWLDQSLIIKVKISSSLQVPVDGRLGGLCIGHSEHCGRWPFPRTAGFWGCDAT